MILILRHNLSPPVGSEPDIAHTSETELAPFGPWTEGVRGNKHKTILALDLLSDADQAELQLHIR